MNRRAAGVAFCAISAFLFATQYIAAAIFGSGVKSWSARLFSSMLRYIGDELTILSVIALIIGVIYLIVAEKSELRSNRGVEKKNPPTT